MSRLTRISTLKAQATSPKSDTMLSTPYIGIKFNLGSIKNILSRDLRINNDVGKTVGTVRGGLS